MRGASPRGAAGVVATLLVLAGCATSRPAENRQGTLGQLAELGWAVSELRRDVAGLSREVTELRSQLGRVQGNVQDNEGRLAEGVRGIEDRLATSERRLAGLMDTVTGLEASVGGLADQVARLEAFTPALPERGPGTQRRPPRAPAGAPTPSAEELFDRGMESLRGGELGQGILDLEEFVAKHPTHPLVGSAQFWIGEAYFRAREYRHAAVEYQKAVDLAPHGEKTPEALFKLGLTHRALRHDDQAREAWARLVREFPESEAAQKAKRESSRLGRPPAAGDAK